jgi:MFS family permease
MKDPKAPANRRTRTKFYFYSRFVSSLLDESWRVIVPVAIVQDLASATGGGALAGYAVASSAGILLGFIIAPFVSNRIGAIRGTILLDFLNALAMLMVAFFWPKDDQSKTVLIMSIIGLVSSLLLSLWFALSEVFPRLITNSDDQLTQMHRWSAIATSCGPLFGPLLGLAFLEHIGIRGFALLNAASFLIQMGALAQFRFIQAESQSNSFSTIAGIRSALLNPIISNLMAVPTLFRLIYYSFITFLPVLLNRGQVPVLITALVIAAPAGGAALFNLLPTRWTRTNTAQRLPFLVFSLFTSASAFIIFSIATPGNSLLFFGLLLGIIMGAYQLSIKLIRDWAVEVHQLPLVIAGSGLLVRLVGPVGAGFYGVIYGLEFTR